MILVVDYDAGNLRSVETALRYLGVSFETSGDYRRLAVADKIIFPGVGQAAHAMSVIRKRRLAEGLESALREDRPLLGICVGSQIILEHSDEGDTPCLGLIEGRVRALAADPEKEAEKESREEPGAEAGGQPGDNSGGPRLKVPHIGWNQVQYEEGHPAARLFRDIPQGSSFYFVHGFYPQPGDSSLVLARTDYGLTFPSVYGQNSLLACQFHPEKSGPVGLRLLSNFIRLF